MANPLAKSIMNNISKKKIDKYDKCNDLKNQCSINNININEKEEEVLKSILHKNKNKVNLNTLKKEQFINKQPVENNSKKTSIKELANKKETKETSNNINSKDKENKKIISLRDLAK